MTLPLMPEAADDDGGMSDEQFVDTLMYCLTAPHIGYGDGTVKWPEALERQKDEITLARFAHAMDIQREQKATELEAMLYLSTASLEAPLTREAFRIYMWLFKHLYPGESLAHGIAEDMGDLEPHERQKLDRLRRSIYRSQMAHLKSRKRSQPAPADGGKPSRAERRRKLREARKRLGIESPGFRQGKE